MSTTGVTHIKGREKQEGLNGREILGSQRRTDEKEGEPPTSRTCPSNMVERGMQNTTDKGDAIDSKSHNSKWSCEHTASQLPHRGLRSKISCIFANSTSHAITRCNVAPARRSHSHKQHMVLLSRSRQLSHRACYATPPGTQAPAAKQSTIIYRCTPHHLYKYTSSKISCEAHRP